MSRLLLAPKLAAADTSCEVSALNFHRGVFADLNYPNWNGKFEYDVYYILSKSKSRVQKKLFALFI